MINKLEYRFNPKMFSPLYWHIKPLLQDSSIRYIFVEGGSSATKTYTICQALAADQCQHDYSSMIFRRQHVDIKDSIYESFNAAISGMGMKGDYYIFQQDLIKSIDSRASIRFRGLDSEENIKGIEKYNIVWCNEWSQFSEAQWSQLRKRLRGKINQKFICDWNPISSKLWQYEEWIDKDEWIDLPMEMADCPSKYSGLDLEHSFKKINKSGNTVWIKVTYRDNFWIVGHPSGKGGYIDEHTLADFEYDRIYKPNLYRIYANGERGIIRTGGEFWKQFNEVKHVAPVTVLQTPIHLTCDQNANPYVTISAWQLQQKQITQVKEFPCKTPDNNAVKSAQKVIKWLKSIDYSDILYIYGDPSGNNQNVIDENNRSFFDKFIETLENAGYHCHKRVDLGHKQVALTADFVNDIYELELYGYSIMIGDNCPVSIDDYISVKEDKNGGMLKVKIKDKLTQQTYEPYGHFSDAKRYFIVRLLETEFIKYRSKQGIKLHVFRPA